MALPTVNLTRTKAVGTHIVPVVDPTNWQPTVFVTAAGGDGPLVNDAANLLKPDAITRAGQNRALMGFAATGVRACMRYTTGTPVTQNPIIRIAGIDANGVPQLLTDAAGAFQWTLTYALASDLKYTQDGPVNYSVCAPTPMIDCSNSTSLIVLVVTEAVGGGAGLAIMLLAQ